MPYEDINEETVIRVAETFKNSPFLPNATSHLCQVRITKSSSSVVYHRSFNKVDAYFSYVGGLVGTIIGLIFIMELYTEKAYELSLARKLFLDNDSQ